MGTVAAGTSSVLTQGDLDGSVMSGRLEGGNDNWPMPVQKSDLSIGAMKRGNARRAKGEMG
jgi:hypothetical protein